MTSFIETRLTHNHKAGQVVGVREIRPIPRLNRDRAVKAERLNIAASSFDVPRVSIQAVNDISFIVTQRGRQPAVSTVNVDNQSALDAGLFQNFPGGLAMGSEG
jgi:hypothetical protein